MELRTIGVLFLYLVIYGFVDQWTYMGLLASGLMDYTSNSPNHNVIIYGIHIMWDLQFTQFLNAATGQV